MIKRVAHIVKTKDGEIFISLEEKWPRVLTLKLDNEEALKLKKNVLTWFSIGDLKVFMMSIFSMWITRSKRVEY